MNLIITETLPHLNFYDAWVGTATSKLVPAPALPPTSDTLSRSHPQSCALSSPSLLSHPDHRPQGQRPATFTLCFFSSLMAFWVAFCSCTHSCWYRCCSRSKKGVDGLWGRSPGRREVLEGSGAPPLPWHRGHLSRLQGKSLSLWQRVARSRLQRSERLS